MYRLTKLQRSADPLQSIHGRMTYKSWCIIEAVRLSKGKKIKHIMQEFGKKCCIVCMAEDDPYFKDNLDFNEGEDYERN